VATTFLLKTKTRTVWKQFCRNINSSSTLHSLWQTAKRFRNCIQSTRRLYNDDWFDDFCSKVDPCYVPSVSGSFHTILMNASQFSRDHCFNLPLTFDELNLAIHSRKSITPSINNISFLMLKCLRNTDKELLLSIFNNLILSNQIPLLWSDFKIISIPIEYDLCLSVN